MENYDVTITEKAQEEGGKDRILAPSRNYKARDDLAAGKQAVIENFEKIKDLNRTHLMIVGPKMTTSYFAAVFQDHQLVEPAKKETK